MSLRAKQALTVAVGILVAGVMLLLGLWQMSSYRQSLVDIAAERAAQPPVALQENTRDDGTFEDIYGRRVTVEGTWLPEYERLVGTEWPMRVASLLRLDDGRHLTVVRGATDSAVTPASGASGELVGIFTAGDQQGDGSPPPDAPESALPSLRLQTLVQEWPQPLLAGYVTVLPETSEALGLAPADAELPEQEGTSMHQGYALQWWVFAGAAVVFSVVVARGYREQDRVAQPSLPAT